MILLGELTVPPELLIFDDLLKINLVSLAITSLFFICKLLSVPNISTPK